MHVHGWVLVVARLLCMAHALGEVSSLQADGARGRQCSCREQACIYNACLGPVGGGVLAVALAMCIDAALDCAAAWGPGRQQVDSFSSRAKVVQPPVNAPAHTHPHCPNLFNLQHCSQKAQREMEEAPLVLQALQMTASPTTTGTTHLAALQAATHHPPTASTHTTTSTAATATRSIPTPTPTTAVAAAATVTATLVACRSHGCYTITRVSHT